jgi:hypothetical protein
MARLRLWIESILLGWNDEATRRLWSKELK